MQTKHKYQGQDLKDIETAFRKVAAENPLVKNRKFSYKYKDNLQNELKALDTECKLVLLMYKLNDFVASSYAYAFTMRKIEEIVDYCYENMKEKVVSKWCNETSDFAVSKNHDGSTKKHTNLGYIYDYLCQQQMAIAARYFIEYNIQYLERNKKGKKSYPQRARILEGAIWWENQGLLGRFGLKMPFTPKEYDIMPELVIFSTFPSSGKSFLVNTSNAMFMQLNNIINEQGGALRIGNQEDNILAQSRQTMDLIRNPLSIDIYPELKKSIIMGKYKPFAKESESEWGLVGANYTPSNSVFKTRDGTINSIRCIIAYMDDPSRGQQENTNVEIHKKIINLFHGDIQDRFDSPNDKFITLTGTMFAPFDIFATEIKKAFKNGHHIDRRFRNTYISKNKKVVAIINDCEDEYGHSAYPEFISDEALQDKRESLDPYDYACVWRQKPIPPEGLIFAKENMNFYDEIPTEQLDKYSKAFIDPTRKSARDYFSMPICKYCENDGMWYLVDAIYEQKSSIDLFETVIERIKTDKIIHLVIEENIDASLSCRIKDRLKQDGIKWCFVETVYNTVPKSKRIANMAITVKNGIKFPSESIFADRSQIKLMVRDLTQYSTIGRNVHDDSPDSICGFAERFIFSEDRKNSIEFRTRPFM